MFEKTAFFYVNVTWIKYCIIILVYDLAKKITCLGPQPLNKWELMKSYLPGRKIYFPWMTERDFFNDINYMTVHLQ